MHTGRSSGITSFPRLILSTSEGSVQRANYNFITAADEPGTSHAPPNAPAALQQPEGILTRLVSLKAHPEFTVASLSTQAPGTPHILFQSLNRRSVPRRQLIHLLAFTPLF